MRKFLTCLCLLFLLPAFSPKAQSQPASNESDSAKASAAPAHYYSLKFVLEELDSAGKPVNSRSFVTSVSTPLFQSSSIVTGSRIPLATASQGSKDGSDKFSTEFTYIDVGVKITTREVHEDGDRLSLNLDTVVSSLGAPTMLAGVAEPLLHNNQWRGTVLVPIGKPATVFKSDSLDSKGSMQLVVTATRVE
jgi:hypothetical protein